MQENEWIEEIGQRLRECRQHLGMSQEEAAEMLGCTQCKISRMENGIGVHDLYTLHEFAAGFGVPLDWIIFGVVLKEGITMDKTEKVIAFGNEDDTAGRRSFSFDDITAWKDGKVYSFYDSDGEMTGEKISELRKRGYNIHFSFLSAIKSSPIPEEAARRMAADILSHAEEKEGYWRNAETDLLAFLLLYVAMPHKGMQVKSVEGLCYVLSNEEERRKFVDDLPPDFHRMYAAFSMNREANQVLAAVYSNIRKTNIIYED